MNLIQLSKIKNLTGHEITIVDRQGNIIKNIEPDEKLEPLRADFSMVDITYLEGVPVSILSFKVNYPAEDLRRLESEYEALIVSKITAEGLRSIGYRGTLLIAGRKFYQKGELIGVNELSLV